MEMEGDDYYRGRGGRNGNGGRFGRRQQDWDSRGNMRGHRGGRNQDNGGRYMNGRGSGPIQPFIGRGGARGPVGNSFSFMGLNGGFPDLANASPEIIRKEVIPTLVRMGEEGKRSGSMNEASFRDLMSQIAVLNETTLIKEQEMRMNRAQENKENQRQGERGSSGRPILLGPPPLINGDTDAGFRQGDGRSHHKNDLPLADQLTLETIEGDPTKSLPIDELPRMIRFYDETATIVMSDDNVCELSFQPDTEDRRVIIDDTVVVYTRVNQGYKEFELEGEKHELKIGPPTRELWVDGKWYECYFNNSAGVKIGNSLHEVFLDGHPPTVKIGEKRPDLCLARIFALLDGNVNVRIPIFLDRKPQLIEIAGKPHVIQFVEGFKTLTINGHPFRSDFGGFPMVISVHGKKHYLRLTALPPGIDLDFIPQRKLSPDSRSPSSQLQGPSPSELSVAEPRRSVSPHLDTDPVSPISPHDECSGDGVGLRKQDPLNSLMSLFPTPPVESPGTGSSYNTNTNTAGSENLPMPPAPPAPLAPPAALAAEPPKDVNAIFESLKQFDWSGFGFNFGSTGGGIPGLTETAPARVEVKPPPELVPQPVIKNTPELKALSVPIRPIVLASHLPTLKERQESIIEQLYRSDDLQCKSCGVRFSKDEMPQYTSHLDWHFRMKRREKDNAKRAQSRKWYLEKVDWIMSDEIEDEAAEDLTEEDLIAEEEIVISTVAVVEGEGNTSVCPVCREEFDQFYKQGDGMEEGGWYLHNAVRVDGVLYHPECHKDMEKVGHGDTSVDTTIDTMDTSEEKVHTDGLEEPVGQILELVKEEPEADIDVKPEVLDNDSEKIESSVEKMDTECIGVKEEGVEKELKPTDDNDNNVEVKGEVVGEGDESMEEVNEDEVASANNSLVADGAESGANSLSAPVVAQPKVVMTGLHGELPVLTVQFYCRQFYPT